MSHALHYTDILLYWGGRRSTAVEQLTKVSMMKRLGVGLAVASSLLIAANANALSFYNGHWYEVVSSGQNGSWANAEAAAVANGGHLVTINDAAEQAWLVATFGSPTALIRYWIGYNDAAQEGTWVWSSGQTPGFTYWDLGEPNNASPPPEGEDYAVLNWNSSGQWNDWDHQRGDYSYINGIAEYERNPHGVPDAGSTAAMLGLGWMALAALRRRFGK